MGLQQIQQVLVRLYTDSEFRESFFADPFSSMVTYNLTANDLEHLKQLSQQHVSSFAESLVQKRLHEVKRLLPLTSKLLAEECKPLFLKFAQQYVPGGIKKHHQDACAFAQWLPSAWSELDLPPWANEVAQLEVDTLQFSLHQKKLAWRFFTYPIRNVAHGIKTNQPYTSGKRPTLFIWHRFTQKPTRVFAIRLI